MFSAKHFKTQPLLAYVAFTFLREPRFNTASSKVFAPTLILPYSIGASLLFLVSTIHFTATSPTPLILLRLKNIRCSSGSQVKFTSEKLTSGGRTSISTPIFFYI